LGETEHTVAEEALSMAKVRVNPQRLPRTALHGIAEREGNICRSVPARGGAPWMGAGGAATQVSNIRSGKEGLARGVPPDPPSRGVAEQDRLGADRAQPKLLLTLDRVADRLDVGRTLVYRLVHQGKLRHLRPEDGFGRYLVPARWLEEDLERIMGEVASGRGWALGGGINDATRA